MHAYEQRQWQITEKPFIREKMPHTETIFTIGNGLVGVRGTFEEGYPGEDSTTLVAGIFNHQAGELIPELVSMPNWLSLRVGINGDSFRLDKGRVLGYERQLDMRTGTLKRGVLWLSPGGTVLRLAFERFASLANQHIMALQVLIQPLSEGTHDIYIESALDGSVTNPRNIDHWQTLVGQLHPEMITPEMITIEGVTNQSNYRVAMAAALLVEGAESQPAVAPQQPRIPAQAVCFTAAENQKIIVTKLVAVHTTRDTTTPLDAARKTLEQAVTQGYVALKTAHDAEWAQYWDAADICIEGDEVAQRGVRFCLYHLLITAPRVDERVSIAAKTLSGFGYSGHVFWDTELFILPPLAMTLPDLTRRMLMYRYHNLQGARSKAKSNGYEGAMFPWESTDTGEETTPQWTHPHPETGERIRIWTGDNEQHISTDIAYATLHYWRWTGEDTWFAQYGAELVLDTAKFWGSRAEYNAAKERYELRRQIGPDEYHENVDNSVFTNRMVVWHLQQAFLVLDWLKQTYPHDAERLITTLDLNEKRLAHWQDIIARMWIPMSDEGGGVFEQFENFFERLKPINLQDYTPRTTNMDWILGHAKTQQTRVIKQADVVMLMALLGNELGDDAFLKRNWAVYAPICDQGSSLSPSMHAWVAARLGYVDEAYDYFLYSATMDLDDQKGNVHDGIHAACCGGVLQAVLFGFCGLELAENGIMTKPMLPAHWRRVAFKVMHKGKRYPIEIVR